MAQHIWVGTTGDYDTGANWNPDKPSVATDDVIVPASTTQAITTGADNENAVDLNSIYIERGHNQDVATSGAPWYIGSDLLVHEGGGTLYFKAGDSFVDDVIINATPATAGAKSASLTGVTSVNSYDRIKVVRGDVDIEAIDFTIDELLVGYVGSQASDVRVDCKSVNGTITDCHVYGGLLILNRPVTRLVVTGGRVVIDDYDPTTVYQYGGVVEYMNAGTIGTYNLGGGTLDLTKSYDAKTITTLNLFGSPNMSRIIEDRYVTVTTRNDYRIEG